MGVTHAPMTKLSRYVKPGIKPQMNKLVMSQADNITGNSSVTSDSHSLRRYARGSAMPVNSTWMPTTIRVNWNVRRLSASGSSPTQLMGEKMSAAMGPKMIPATTARSASAESTGPVSDVDPHLIALLQRA